MSGSRVFFLWIAGSAVILLLGATSLAVAQPRQPVADVAAGSHTLWPGDREDPAVVLGWFVSVDEHRTDRMAIAYEFEHYFRDRSDTHGDTQSLVTLGWPASGMPGPAGESRRSFRFWRARWFSWYTSRTYRRTFRELMSKRDSPFNLAAGLTSISPSAWRFGSRPTS